MEKIHSRMAAFFTGMYHRDEREDRGAGILEYGLLVALIAIGAIVGITAFGDELDAFFTSLGSQF
jgi:pilus assembly protein Flp/PilA